MQDQAQSPQRFRNIGRFIQRMNRRFYDGPAVFNYPGRKIIGYRSPTVVAWIWLKSWALTWFTAPGRILLAVACMVGLTGMMSDLMPIYYLSFLLIGVYIIDFIIGRIFRPNLELTRSIPATATVGIPFRVQYRISAVGKRPAWGIHIDTVLPPLHMKFVDPGLQLASPPETPLELERTLVAARRGRYHMPLAVADSAFPFGLWRAGCRAPANPPILVLPAFRPLDHMPLPSRAGNTHGGETESATPGNSLHFLSCRDYRYGDNPRHIHGPAWARLGTPIVKEFSDECALKMGLVVDLRTPQPTFTQYLERELLGHANHRFEALMSVTAALADYVIRAGSPLVICIPHLQAAPIVLNIADPMRELLSILAILDPAPNQQDLPLSTTTRAELNALSSIISVTALPDQTWQQTNAKMTKDPASLKAIALTEKLPRAADHITYLKTADILAGKVASIG